MRRNGRLLIVLGVTLALAAVALAVFALTGKDNKDDTTSGSTKTTSKNTVVVQAKKDIPAHTVLKLDDLEEVEVAADQVSPDSVQAVGEAVGFSYSLDLVQGQRLLRSNLEQPGLANELTAGTRAISLPVEKSNLLGGLLRDDDRVDIVYDISVNLIRVLPTEPIELPEDLTLRDIATTLAPYGENPGPTYPYPGEEGSRFVITDVQDGDPQAKLVLQNLRVIRVVAGDSNATSGNSSSDGSFVILEVDAQQAEMLTFMANNGNFQIVLRSPDDTDVAQTTGINLERMVTNYAFPYPKTVRVPGPGAQ